MSYSEWDEVEDVRRGNVLMVQVIDAGRDRNGNARRAWTLWAAPSDGAPVEYAELRRVVPVVSGTGTLSMRAELLPEFPDDRVIVLPDRRVTYAELRAYLARTDRHGWVIRG